MSRTTHLKAGGAPVHELNGALRLDGCDGGVHIFGHHVPSVEQAARHVLSCEVKFIKLILLVPRNPLISCNIKFIRQPVILFVPKISRNFLQIKFHKTTGDIIFSKVSLYFPAK